MTYLLLIMAGVWTLVMLFTAVHMALAETREDEEDYI